MHSESIFAVVITLFRVDQIVLEQLHPTTSKTSGFNKVGHEFIWKHPRSFAIADEVKLFPVWLNPKPCIKVTVTLFQLFINVSNKLLSGLH